MPIFVNGREISDDMVHREMQYHPASSADQAMEKAAQALTIRELLLQEARQHVRTEILSNMSDDELIEALLDDVIDVEAENNVQWAAAVRDYIQNLICKAHIIGLSFVPPARGGERDAG